LGMPYETARDAYAPYDRLDHVEQAMRDDVVSLAKQCHDEGRVLWVLVDNKAEGCAPLTIRGITQQLVDAFGAPTSG
ncbi:MAG: DUF72 domain-containing protein, partial [Archangium sp.]|nr:DUF72 domain-containing protein [Archangium sp.]